MHHAENEEHRLQRFQAQDFLLILFTPSALSSFLALPQTSSNEHLVDSGLFQPLDDLAGGLDEVGAARGVEDHAELAETFRANMDRCMAAAEKK